MAVKVICPYEVGQEYVIPSWWMKGEPCRVRVVGLFSHDETNRRWSSITVQPLEGNSHQRLIILDERGNIASK